MKRIAVCLAILLAVGSTGVTAAPPAADHDRMVELLARLAERDPARAAYSQRVEQLKTRLFQLRRSVSDIQRLGIRHALGRALLQNGAYYEALENFDQMRRETRVLTASQALPVALTAHFWAGATQLRLATDENCGSAASRNCRFPMSGGWKSELDDWPRRATDSFESVLHLAQTGSELALASSWLSQLTYDATGVAADGIARRISPPEDAFRTDLAGIPPLADAADTLGVAAATLSGGVVADDLDGDGWIDLMVSSADLRSQIRVHRNEQGRFVDVTEESGLTGITGGHNLVQADYDNDGDLDVLVLRGGWLGHGGALPNSLLRNEGNFHFVDVSFEVGLGEEIYPSPVGAWGDYDGDGDLDLFVGNDAEPTAGFESQLFRNDGGRFVDVSVDSGVGFAGRVQGAVWGDIDEDGDPDLFVSVFGGPDRLFHNVGDGTFDEVAEEAGVAHSASSGSAWFWDADGDGAIDLLVNAARHTAGSGPDVWYWYADLLGLPHPAQASRLYLGDGDGGFVEAAAEWGIDRVTLARGGNYGDLDNDGRLDFYLTTGYPGYESLVPDLLYIQRDGRFVDATYAAEVGELRRGSAAAFVDFDGDGDQDIFVKRGGVLPDDRIADSLYQNPLGGRWLSVELRGDQANRFGVGARLRLQIEEDDGRERTLTRWMSSGGSFGAGPLRAHFGLGETSVIRSLVIRWPGDDREQRIGDLPDNSRILVSQAADGFRVLQRQQPGDR